MQSSERPDMQLFYTSAGVYLHLTSPSLNREESCLCGKSGNV